MGIRKFRPERLFDGKRFAPPGTVLVCDETGRVISLLANDDDATPLEGILLPGMVNCHCHLELSHLKGRIPGHTGMVPFLVSVMKNRFNDETMIGEAMFEADKAMYNSGIVAVGDICNTANSVEVKKQSRIRYINFIEVSGFVPSGAHHRYEQAVAVQQAFEPLGDAFIVPHAPYSVSPELFGLLEASPLSTMHNQESAEENEFFMRGTGPFNGLFSAIGVDIGFFRPPHTSSLQAVIPFLPRAGNLILVHNTETSAEDLFAWRQAGALLPVPWFCLCVRANQYINSSLPPVDLLAGSGYRIVLGTDSLASNHSLDLMAELFVLLDHFPELPLETALHWATLAGAEALGLQQQLGSFEKGKQPGLVLLQGRSAKRIL
ncbi:MAG: amidohydrolase family protein [Flavihumibacter sp.]